MVLRLRNLAIVAMAALLCGGVMSVPDTGAETSGRSHWPEQTGDVSAMSYNVKGLPWPVALGREDAISTIGLRLATMRSDNVQPHVVMLQEAFGDTASSIADSAGYSHVVRGPQTSRLPKSLPMGEEYADRAQWIKGEQSGNVLDSGLAILSDYPVVRTARFAFPRGACAGYDCLAAKGVLVAWIKIPGTVAPIAFVNTHLNARRATRVPSERADEAYAWQIGATRAFISRVLSPETAVIFGGDFNTGQVPARIAAASKPLIGANQVDSLATLLTEGRVVATSRLEAKTIVEKNKDKILYRHGIEMTLRPERAWVPFPVNTNDALSDHAGFVIDFTING